PADYAFTAGDAGTRTFLNALVLKTAGTQTVTSTDTMTASITGSASAPVSPGPAAALILTTANSAIAGSSFAVSVEARDVYANRATGYHGTVQFTSSAANATLPGATAFSAADLGIKTFPSLVLRTAGTQSITVTDGTIIGTQRDITVTSPDIPIWPSGSTLSAS